MNDAAILSRPAPPLLETTTKPKGPNQALGPPPSYRARRNVNVALLISCWHQLDFEVEALSCLFWNFEALDDWNPSPWVFFIHLQVCRPADRLLLYSGRVWRLCCSLVVSGACAVFWSCLVLVL